MNDHSMRNIQNKIVLNIAGYRKLENVEGIQSCKRLEFTFDQKLDNAVIC